MASAGQRDPTWPPPNFINPEDRGPALFNLCILFSILGTFTVGFRLYARLFLTKALGIDDILVVFSLMFCIALSVLIIIANKKFHLGRHVWDIPVSTISPHRQNVWISQWCYIAAAALVKISVLLFYRRLSVKFTRAFLVATWIGIVYNICYFITFGVILLRLCTPVHAYWMRFEQDWAATHSFRCNSEAASLPISSALSVVGDVYSTALPFALIWNLKLPRRQKVALYALFSVGLLAIGAGIARTVLLYIIHHTKQDLTFILWETWIWALVELYGSLFAASAPALKTFFREVVQGPVASLRKSSSADRGRPESGKVQDENGTHGSTARPLIRDEEMGLNQNGHVQQTRDEAFLRGMIQQAAHQGRPDSTMSTRELQPHVKRPISKFVDTQKPLPPIKDLERHELPCLPTELPASPAISPSPSGQTELPGSLTALPDLSAASLTVPRGRQRLNVPEATLSRISEGTEGWRSSQQTIHVGLQILPEMTDFDLIQLNPSIQHAKAQAKG
ncbi:hypothetical protein B0A52_06825 [Exophiala mesophila]|uniref:Rhodopsin domain-containing protein n=1 Tax=Exophiala mesophila TaxID=212818 RepID=A0A438N0H5_EXOME|nr:hypothetical protein B0A52_06825 [Exophiala mesophila]